MTSEEALNILTTVFHVVLDNTSIQLSPSTVAADIEEWDSLTHIQLVVAIEKKFNIRFTSSEIQSWKDVGQMLETICNRKNA